MLKTPQDKSKLTVPKATGPTRRAPKPVSPISSAPKGRQSKDITAQSQENQAKTDLSDEHSLTTPVKPAVTLNDPPISTPLATVTEDAASLDNPSMETDGKRTRFIHHTESWSTTRYCHWTSTNINCTATARWRTTREFDCSAQYRNSFILNKSSYSGGSINQGKPETITLDNATNYRNGSRTGHPRPTAPRTWSPISLDRRGDAANSIRYPTSWRRGDSWVAWRLLADF